MADTPGWRPPPTPTFPVPAKRNPNGAVADLTLARSYLDGWYTKANPADLSDCVFAVRYVASARLKDPDAAIVVEKKNGPATYYANDLEAEALYIESIVLEQTDQQLKALEVRKQAIALAPERLHYIHGFAKLLLNLHHRDEAISVLKYILLRNAFEMDSRKLLDSLEANPTAGAPPSFTESNPGVIIIVAFLIGILGLFLMFQVNFVLGLLLAAAGLACYFVGRSRENKQMLEKIMADGQR